MPRSLSVTAESPADTSRLYAAFSSEDYWRARLAVNDSGPATLDSLIVDTDGTVNVAMTLRPLSSRLPGLITQVYRGELTIRHTERWDHTDDDQVRGQVRFAVSGLPLSGLGNIALTPLAVPRLGSRLTCTATVKAGLPMVGGTVERFIGGRLPQGILAAQRFTDQWIAENC